MKYKKNGSLLRQEPKIKRFEFIKANRNKYRVAKLCSVLEVSKSIYYYAWDKRPDSNRSKANKMLLKKIKDVYNESGKREFSVKKTNEKMVSDITYV